MPGNINAHSSGSGGHSWETLHICSVSGSDGFGFAVICWTLEERRSVETPDSWPAESLRSRANERIWSHHPASEAAIWSDAAR